jgi:hypothetical protein
MYWKLLARQAAKRARYEGQIRQRPELSASL